MTRPPLTPPLLAALVTLAGCLGGASQDAADTPTLSTEATTTATTAAPRERETLNWGEFGVLLPDDIGGQTITFRAGPDDPDWYAHVPNRPSYVQIWNRTGLAHYSEWPSGLQETTNTVVVPPDPPYLMYFSPTTSVAYLKADAPPGEYTGSWLRQNGYPDSPHDQVTDFMSDERHEHRVRVESGQTEATVEIVVPPSLTWHFSGLDDWEPGSWGRATVYDPVGRDNSHWDRAPTGNDVYYWGSVGMSGTWNITLRLNVTAITPVEWVIGHQVYYWAPEIRQLGFDWPDSYWDGTKYEMRPAT